MSEANEQFWVSADDLEATERVGTAIAEQLNSMQGCEVCIGLIGELGAGKTTLVRAIAMALGVDSDEVNSPTFSLVQVYEGHGTLVHIDTWRINDEDEYGELGLDEYFRPDVLVLVEWADRFADLLPADRLTIEILASPDGPRRFGISWPGPSSDHARLGNALRRALENPSA